MMINKNHTAFDVLAILCSLLNKEDERKYSIAWATADERHIQGIISRYANFLAVILNASANEYRFDSKDISYLNKKMGKIKERAKTNKEDIYRLAIEVEKRLDMYSNWQNRGVIYRLEPLNINVKETGIAIYPHILPQWNTEKSERNRERRLNADFTNYMMIRSADVSPFEIIMHYWNDRGLLIDTENGWKLKVGLSPVMDYASLKTEERDSASGYVVGVEGLTNEETVTDRELQIFDKMFSEEYGIIVFPEALGTEVALEGIKNKMREHPEYYTFVLVPTICHSGKNTLIVLGPGGIEFLRQEKTTPAILITEDGKAEREDLLYSNQIHLLITQELGLVAFSICAELLDPDYYRLLVDTMLTDTIVCSSFSPGVNAFHDTLLKGTPAKLLELYINTCSAKEISRNRRVAEPLGLVQVPYSDEKFHLRNITRECQGICSEEICYFDITIIYKDQKFWVESVHKRCA